VGFEHATGNYVAVLNPDTTVAADWLQELVLALEGDPSAGLATSKILQMNDPEEISACGLDLHCTGLALARGKGMSRDTFMRCEAVPSVSGAAFVIRRNVLETLDGFDEDFFIYMEDVDLSLRARLAGYKVLYVPGSVAYHDYALHFGPKKTLYQERNRYLVLLKSLRWRTLLVLLPALLLAEVVTWGFVLLSDRRNCLNKCRACALVATHWKDTMKKRQRAQALRQVSDRDLVAQCTHQLAYEQTGSDKPVWLAHIVFDPLFCLFRQLALLVVRW
jgi:GT2 family glycosyltransferase